MQATINLLRTSSTTKRSIVQSTSSFKSSIILPTSQNLPRQLRSYHSHEHADPPLPYNAQETAILNAALEHVPEHGFTETSLAMGSRDAGYLDITTNLFPNGAFDVIKFHLIKERCALKDRVDFANRSSLTIKDGRDGKGPGVGQKIRTLCVERLKRNEPIIHRWQEVCNFSIIFLYEALLFPFYFSLMFIYTKNLPSYKTSGSSRHVPLTKHQAFALRTIRSSRRDVVSRRR